MSEEAFLDPEKAVARIKELLERNFHPQERGDILLSLLADLAVECSGGEVSEIGHLTGEWSVQIVKEAAEKFFKKHGAKGLAAAFPLAASRLPPLRPPARARVQAFATAARPSGEIITTRLNPGCMTEILVSIKKNQDGKWVVLVCPAKDCEPGQILMALEREDFGSKKEAKAAVEAAVSDIAASMEPWDDPLPD